MDRETKAFKIMNTVCRMLNNIDQEKAIIECMHLGIMLVMLDDRVFGTTASAS